MRERPLLWRHVMDFLRGATGEGSYERYCAHLRAAHPEQPLPSRAEFFRQGQHERWDGVRRCC
jgi:uncharacterized short protein YbdD (DUF466 family)